MKAAELFISCLERAGVTHVFGVAGEENLAMLEAIRKSKITFVTTRDEQAAAFMATVHGQLSGSIGVAIATLGPGATNLLNGVAYAQLGGVPLLVVTGQKPIKKRRQSLFQLVDVCGTMRPVTKFSEVVVSADRVPALVYHALRTAQSGRPGAVHLELPEDIADEETNESVPAWHATSRPQASPSDIEQLARAIEKATSPMLVLAGGANNPTVRKPLHDLIAKTGLPFATSQLGKGAEDERSDGYIGSGALSANDYVHRALDTADLLLVVGYDPYEKPPFFAKPGQTIISISNYPTDTNEIWQPSQEIVGDIAAALQLLADAIKPQVWDFEQLAAIKQAMQADITSQLHSDAFPVKPQRLVGELRQLLPDDAILSLDNGMYKLWIARNYPAYHPRSIFLDNTLATMGAGLPVGMAVKMLNPDKKVVVVAGDGGFMMNIADLETAMRLQLNLMIVIVNDNGYGMIKWKQAGMKLPSFGLEFGNPDFVKLAESFGATGYRINRADDLAPTLKKALQAGGIHIIDVPVDYNENATLESGALEARTKHQAKETRRDAALNQPIH